MTANAWVMTGFSDEADATINTVMGNDGTWIDVTTDATLINAATTYLDGVFTVEEVRGVQGDFQRKYTDRDVRMQRATVTVALVT